MDSPFRLVVPTVALQLTQPVSRRSCCSGGCPATGRTRRRQVGHQVRCARTSAPSTADPPRPRRHVPPRVLAHRTLGVQIRPATLRASPVRPNSLGDLTLPTLARLLDEPLTPEKRKRDPDMTAASDHQSGTTPPVVARRPLVAYYLGRPAEEWLRALAPAVDSGGHREPHSDDALRSRPDDPRP
jgi:hypothetical protein